MEELEQILATGAACRREQQAGTEADLLGVNMEGPFISEAKKGAQDARNILPCDVDIFHRFQKAAEGMVNYIGIAPEREGALEFVDAVKDEVHVSLAHTNADYDAAKAAYDRGACHAVHLFNAMPAFSHRAPGVVGAVSDSPHVMAELICDGVHIHPAMVRSAFRMLGKDRIIFISDSMRATGMPDGRYTLGGLDVDVKGQSRHPCVGRRPGRFGHESHGLPAHGCPEDGDPAGDSGCLRICESGPEPWRRSARLSITPGKKADIVLLREDLSLRAVIKDGKVL